MGLESPQQQPRPLLWIGSFCGAIALHLGVFWLGRFLWLQQLSAKSSSSTEDYIAIEFLVTPDSPDPVESSSSPSQDSPPTPAVPSLPTTPTEDSVASPPSVSNPPQLASPISPSSSPSPQSPIPSPDPSPQVTPPTSLPTPIPTPIPSPTPTPTRPPAIPEPFPSPSAPPIANPTPISTPTPQPSPTTAEPPVIPSNPPIASNPEPSPPSSATGLEVSLGSLQLTNTSKDIPDQIAIATQQRQQLLASDYLDPLGVDLQQNVELQVVVVIDNQGQAEVLPDFTEVKQGEIPAQTATNLTEKILQQWSFQPTMMGGQSVTQVYYLTLTIRPMFSN